MNMPAEVARCRPSKPCDFKHGCARYLAPLPERYGRMIDGSLTSATMVFGFKACHEWLNPEKYADAKRVLPPMGAKG